MSFWRGPSRGEQRPGPLFRRGRAGQRHAAFAAASLEPPRPFGPALDNIDIKSLLIEEDSPKIENVTYVASYNWLDGAHPVILVPGSPPAWTPPSEDTQLTPDSQDVFRDINAARYAAYPMEPAIRSILALEPDFDLQAVDVMGCGSTMGNLLRLVSSQGRPFRFDVDLIGETVFFVRHESSPAELIKDLRGYGHTFPEMYTTWNSDVGQSCSHQRIVQYEFGGLRFLIRSETDGYVKEPTSSRSSSTTKSLSSTSDMLGTMSMGNVGPSTGQKLLLKIQGDKIPQDRIFDIKTRSEHVVFDLNEIIPRLWINQTPRFLLAYHSYGLFRNPSVKDVRQDVLAWQDSNSTTLGRFHALIKRILDVVRDSVNQQIEVSWDGQGPLLITEQIGEGRRVLPPDLYCHWENI